MASPADQTSEIARLRRELDRTRMERDILKKRSAFARRCHGDPQAWLADVLDGIASYPISRLDELLPWNWRKRGGVLSQAA